MKIEEMMERKFIMMIEGGIEGIIIKIRGGMEGW